VRQQRGSFEIKDVYGTTRRDSRGGGVIEDKTTVEQIRILQLVEEDW